MNDKNIAAQAAVPVVATTDDQTMLHKLAFRTLWLAYVWNDHNFDAAHEEARKTCESLGIHSFDEASVWIESVNNRAAASQAAPAEQWQLPKQWRQHVARAYVEWRKHDQTTPDDILDLMRDILYAAEKSVTLPAPEQQAGAAASDTLRAALKPFADAYAPLAKYDNPNLDPRRRAFIDANEVTPRGTNVGDYRRAYDAYHAGPTAVTTSEDARDAALYRWLRGQAIYQQEVSDGWYEIKVEAPLQDDVEVTAEQFDMQVRAAMRATQQEGGK